MHSFSNFTILLYTFLLRCMSVFSLVEDEQFEGVGSWSTVGLGDGVGWCVGGGVVLVVVVRLEVGVEEELAGYALCILGIL